MRSGSTLYRPNALRASTILTRALGGAYSRALLSALMAISIIAYWLFFGSGYRSMHPSAYELTTALLLSHPATALDAAQEIESYGFLSLAAQHRLLDRLGSE